MERSRVTGKAKHILKQFKAWVRNVKQNSGSAHISRVVFFCFFFFTKLNFSLIIKLGVLHTKLQ